MCLELGEKLGPGISVWEPSTYKWHLRQRNDYSQKRSATWKGVEMQRNQ